MYKSRLINPFDSQECVDRLNWLLNSKILVCYCVTLAKTHPPMEMSDYYVERLTSSFLPPPPPPPPPPITCTRKHAYTICSNDFANICRRYHLSVSKVTDAIADREGRVSLENFIRYMKHYQQHQHYYDRGDEYRPSSPHPPPPIPPRPHSGSKLHRQAVYPSHTYQNRRGVKYPTSPVAGHHDQDDYIQEELYKRRQELTRTPEVSGHWCELLFIVFVFVMLLQWILLVFHVVYGIWKQTYSMYMYMYVSCLSPYVIRDFSTYSNLLLVQSKSWVYSNTAVWEAVLFCQLGPISATVQTISSHCHLIWWVWWCLWDGERLCYRLWLCNVKECVVGSCRKNY